jgi:hypothetical protein
MVTPVQGTRCTVKGEQQDTGYEPKNLLTFLIKVGNREVF